MMKRRDFLRSTGAICAGFAFTKATSFFAETSAPVWRTYDVTVRVEVLKPNGETHIWLPAALIRDTPFQKTLANKFTAQDGTAKLIENKEPSLGIVTAAYPSGNRPVLTLTSRVSLKNYAVNLAAPERSHASKAELTYYLQPSKYIPTG